jgi:predicted phage terminase large subunit-like protein
MTASLGISKEDLEASVCRDSFYEFVKRFWGEIIHQEPVWNWHIELFCHELEKIARRVVEHKPKEYDLVINVPPGSTKSTIFSVMFPAWVWTFAPWTSFICASYAYSLAMDLSRRGRLVVKSDKYAKLFGEIELAHDLDSKGYWGNTEGGTRYSAGAGGMVTGLHGDFVVVDDPINPREALSEAELKNVNTWMKETLPTRVRDKSVVPTILVMQRLHQNDPTAFMIERAKEEGATPVRHINLPAEMTDANRESVRPRRVRKKYKDGLLDPVRMPRKVLQASRAALGEYAYAGQFGQSPVPQGGGMFRIANVEFADPPRKMVRRVRFWDKAGTHQAGAYTVGALMGLDRWGTFWVLDIIRGQWDAGERERIIRQTAEMDGKGVTVGVEQEPGSGGKESAQNTVKNLAGWKVVVDRPTGDKITRADPFAVQVNSGNVKLAKGEWNAIYMNELQFFPYSKTKDQVDASAGAFTVINDTRRIGGLFHGR